MTVRCLGQQRRGVKVPTPDELVEATKYVETGQMNGNVVMVLADSGQLTE